MNEATSTIIAHRGARLVNRDTVDAVAVPQSTATWFPVAHSHVLDTTINTLGQAGFSVKRQQLALSGDGDKFFATLDLGGNVAQGVSLSVGVRNSIDKSLPIAFCAGNRVFVCDNLSFSAEVVVSRKHTKFGNDRFTEAIALAVNGLAQFQQLEAQRITRFQEAEISNTTAESLILRAYEKEIVSHYQLAAVLAHWRKPPFADFQAPTLWSLENAFTWALKKVAEKNPQRFSGLTMGLQGLLGEVVDVTPAAPLLAQPA